MRLRQLDQRKAIELGLVDAGPVTANSDLAIADGWESFLDYSGRSAVLGGVSAGTIKRYRAVRDKHVRFCTRHHIAVWNAFDKQQIEIYGNWLSKRFADRTVYFELTLLKSVNHWLIENQSLPESCRLRYPLQKPQGTDTYCYSPSEVSAMIEYCQAKRELAWLRHVVIALAHTGLRIGELAGLRWSDVDLNRNIIRVADERSSRRKKEAGVVRTTKGRRSRTIPIHRRLSELLKALERKPDGWVFHAARGGRLWPRNVLEAFIDDVIEPLKSRFPTPAGETGFEHGRLHSFRHFFCSQAFLGGASEGEIKEWLGHADSRMVEHYRHLRNEEAQRKMDQIDFLGRPAAVAG